MNVAAAPAEPSARAVAQTRHAGFNRRVADTTCTRDLLERWRRGERDALEQLLGRDLDWIRGRVRGAVGARLAARAEFEDYVQDAVVRILEYAPRSTLATREEFRKLLARIVENTIRNRAAELDTFKRSGAGVIPLPSDSDLARDPPARDVTPPSESARRGEMRERVRLAIELLHPDESGILWARILEEASFTEIAVRSGLSEATARKRFARAIPRLARQLERLWPDLASDTRTPALPR